MAFVKGVDNRNFLPARSLVAHRLFHSSSFSSDRNGDVFRQLNSCPFTPRKVCGVRKNSEHVFRLTILKGRRLRKFSALEHIINPLFENLIKGIRS